MLRILSVVERREIGLCVPENQQVDSIGEKNSDIVCIKKKKLKSS